MTSSYLGLILVVLCASSCLSHSDSHGGDVDVNSGVKGGGSGIKSYGGYSHDHNQGSAHQQSQFYQQPARQPQYNYQPYGWNYNQPTRTYGGVIQQNSPNNPQGYGWFGQYGPNQFPNYNNNNGQETIPKLPAQNNPFVPNFAPPIYNFPYPMFPNYNMFPFAGQPNNGGQFQTQNNGGQFPGHSHPVHNHHHNHQVPVGQSPDQQPGERYPMGQNNGAQFPMHNHQHNHQVPVGQSPDQHTGNRFPGGQNSGGQFGQGGQNSGGQFGQGGQNSGGQFGQGGQNSGGQFGQGGQTAGGLYPGPHTPHYVPGGQAPVYPHQGDANNRVDSDDKFLTNAFFNNSQTDEREWTQDDEEKWQATTKAPYFENKVPGLECTLPASAVLGATTALKASGLLPLNVPIGKPILSCNATGLLQAQIQIDGYIYDCDGTAITKSCPRLNSQRVLVDECLGETLECDVRLKPNSRTLSCTNGTLISNQEIICRSAVIMQYKNILNCLFKSMQGVDDRLPESGSAPTYRPFVESTTFNPEVIPLPPVTQNSLDDVDIRISGGNQPPQGLYQEVQHSLHTVFPHELLSVSQSKGYLPPQPSTGAQFPHELKTEMQGVFPYSLFAMSQNDELNDIANHDYDVNDDQSRSTSSGQNINNQATFSEDRRSQWNVDVKTKTGNSDSSTKTKTNTLGQRFGGETQINNEQRLIFTP